MFIIIILVAFAMFGVWGMIGALLSPMAIQAIAGDGVPAGQTRPTDPSPHIPASPHAERWRTAYFAALARGECPEQADRTAQDAIRRGVKLP